MISCKIHSLSILNVHCTMQVCMIYASCTYKKITTTGAKIRKALYAKIVADLQLRQRGAKVVSCPIQSLYVNLVHNILLSYKLFQKLSISTNVQTYVNIGCFFIKTSKFIIMVINSRLLLLYPLIRS